MCGQIRYWARDINEACFVHAHTVLRRGLIRQHKWKHVSVDCGFAGPLRFHITQRTSDWVENVWLRQRRQHWADWSPVTPTWRHAAARYWLERFDTLSFSQLESIITWINLACLKESSIVRLRKLERISQNGRRWRPFIRGEEKENLLWSLLALKKAILTTP